jgi:hypothetical protein
MKIDSALQKFSEKYDRAAIQSIENISKDFGLVSQKETIKGFNIKEGFEDFQDFLTKYAKYKTENMDNPKATPQSMICERVETNTKEEIFKESQMLYNEIPSFVEAYLSGVQHLTATADSVKKSMFESGVDGNSIGDVNGFVDVFMDRLHESFDQTMDRILWASGYNSQVKLSKPKVIVEKVKPVFL